MITPNSGARIGTQMIFKRRSIRMLFLLGIGGGLAGLIATSAVLDRTGAGDDGGNTAEPVVVTGSAYPLAVSPEGAVYLADAGIRGTVVSVGKAEMVTFDGLPPLDLPPGVVPREPFVIYHTAVVRVAESFHGSPPAEVHIAIPGGTLDGMSFEAESGMEGVAKGDTIVAFVVKPPPGTKLEPDNWGLIQGYRVSGGVAHGYLVPDISVTDLVSRARAESARRAAGATEPAN